MNILKIISVNVNLMPAGPLSLLTSGDLVPRARSLAHFLLANQRADIMSIQELYHDEAREVFSSVLTEAGYEVVSGPQKGEHGNNYYKYHSGQVVYVNKHKIHNYKSDTISFPGHGVHGDGPLEKHVPKGAIWVGVQINDEFMLGTYHVHLQSCPFSWVYRFSAKDIRRRQVEQLKMFCQSNKRVNGTQTESAKLFIGDFNIEYSWQEFEDLQTALDATPVNKEKCVTIGNTDNTSHLPMTWRVGGLLYGHYNAQLDHCLVSAALATSYNVNLDTFSLMSDEGKSLTDHEGLCVRIAIV